MEDLIYIVEDDEGIRELYEGAFDGIYETKMFENGNDFFKAFEKSRPCLVVLDIMLPDMDGYTILTKIREIDEKIPVIIVSAKSDEISAVKGLNKGADDYITKPFSVLELIARIKTNIRRSNLYVKNQKGFVIDNNVYKVFFEGRDLGLTLKEFKLLKLLITNSGVTLEREYLFREVWGESYMGETRTLDLHISQLRDKITECGGGDVIVTVRGIGYRFEM